jgi:predicted nucleic acid-binding protein
MKEVNDMTVLIDTNVILDYVLKREPFAQAAFDCLDQLIINKDKVWLTASTITDIFYVTRKALHNAAAAKNVISKLINAFNIAAVDKNDCLNALHTKMDDFEDALVIQCAGRIKVEYIITRNNKHFINSSVPAISPGDFLRNDSNGI